MSDYFLQVEAVIRAVRFHSDTSYAWFGQPSPPVNPQARRALAPEERRDYLVYSLQQQLYRDFYCQGSATPAEPESLYPSAMLGMTPFVQALSAANCGAGCYEEGWKVRAIEDDHLVVQKERLRIWAPRQDCQVPEGASLAAGTPLRVRFPKELLNISPGFYMALGDQRLPDGDDQVVIRLYWNLTPQAAAPFVEQATRVLNQAGLAFRLKVLRDPALYRRCDAAVVYVLKQDYEAVAERLAGVYQEVAPALKPATPALTWRLAPGLGLAEDAGYGESFGENRSRLLAEALVRAWELGRTSLEARLQSVVDCFAEEKLRLEAPYLGPGSRDEYPFGAPA